MHEQPDSGRMHSSTLREADMDARWIALAVLTTARASMGYQFQSLAAVSPLLIDEFGLGYADVGFLIGLYFLPGVALAVPGGLLGQRFGDKRIVLVGLALMTSGGFCAALAESYGLLLVGRLLSGFGAVLLNVLMAKMITDWFANREIVLAMAIFINAFPIGIGLALLSLGWIADSAGWHVALHATAMVTSAALLVVMTLYQRHSNDQLVQRSGSSPERPTSQEITQVCIAGAIWGVYNGVFAILLGFTPLLLTDQGRAVAEAGFTVSLATWLIAVSVQAGGTIAHHWGRPHALMLIGIGSFGLGLLLLPTTSPVLMLLLIGLVGGLPVAIILSLPAEVLRPASRGLGMGLFYTCFYVGMTGLPPVAGWLRDFSGSAAIPHYIGSAFMLSILPLYGLFRYRQARWRRSARFASD
jgi:MFS family permease